MKFSLSSPPRRRPTPPRRIFFAPTWIVFLVCVFVASLGLANTFGMCMGLAINRRPEKTNEVSALVVMAIAGGGVVTPALGLVQGASGVFGCVWVLLACLAYLFALGLMSSLRKRVCNGKLSTVF